MEQVARPRTRWKNHVGDTALEDDLTLLLLQSGPNRPRAQAKLRQAHSAATRRAQLEAAHGAYQLEPSLPETTFLLSRLLLAEGEYESAAEFIEEYLDSGGMHTPQILYRLGYLHFRAGAPDRAKLEFKRALALNHAHADACLMLTKCYLKEGSFIKALRTLERGLDSDPENQILQRSVNRLRAGEGRQLD